MSAWLIGVIVYWVGCFLLPIASMVLCNEHDEHWELLKAIARKKRSLAVVCMSIGLLVLAAIAPIATPYWLVRCTMQARRERAYWSRLQRTHREFIFEPVHPVNLPSKTRAYFESGAGQLQRLGFTALGDYRMKEVPANYFGRCFLSEDGAVVCTLIDIFDEQNYGFSTSFNDGRMLETSSSDCGDWMEWLRECERYRAVYATDEPIESGWRIHQAAIAATIEREDVAPLAFDPEAVLDFIRYEGRLFSQLLFERGELDEPPPAPHMPPHRVAAALDFAMDSIASDSNSTNSKADAELILH